MKASDNSIADHFDWCKDSIGQQGPRKATWEGHLLSMCKYTDKVHRCGHYRRSCDPCEKAEKAKSLCDPPVQGKKKKSSGGGGSNVSYTTGTWCNQKDCDGKAKHKRDGPGRPVLALD